MISVMYTHNMHKIVREHTNTKSTKNMIQKVSIVQNDHTTMMIIKTCNRTHKNKNCGKNYKIQVQKHTKPKIHEMSQTKEKIVKLEYDELRQVG